MVRRGGASMRCRVVTVVGLVVIVSCAHGSRAGAQQVVYAANVMGEMDSATTLAVSREISRARERGIPVEPLVAKVREGRLKRADGERIRFAVSRLAARLDSARAALGAGASTEELVAGAEALARGAGAAALRALRAASTRRLEVPLGTLAQLVASGVSPARAVEMIVSLLRRNVVQTQVAALGNLVEGDVAAGLAADASASIRLRGIEASLGLGDKVELTQTAPTTGSPGAGSAPPPKPSTPTRRP